MNLRNGPDNAPSPLLHVDFVGVAATASASARQALIEEARGLTQLAEVVTAGVIEADDGSDFDLAFYFVLPEFSALEPFGTHPRYSQFLQGRVAPVLRSFAGADVRLDEHLPPVGDYAACFALVAPEETYDWEVREHLQAWADELPASRATLGVAVGERLGYRGLALAFADSPLPALRFPSEGFNLTLVCGKALSFS